MTDILTKINIVGATMVYQEGEQCRWAIDWLLKHCNRVLILLDNWNKETEEIIKEYKREYGDRIRMIYSKYKPDLAKNVIAGQIKRRFKNNQDIIREQVFIELKKMHAEKPIDLLIFPDSDECYINEFSLHLRNFWQSNFKWMMVGFIEVYDSMQILIEQKMVPHGRVYKYTPKITVFPWIGRTRYHPYCDEKKPLKIRYVTVHVCRLIEKYRKRRHFEENSKPEVLLNKRVWFLPRDVREMTAQEIAQYQPSPHGLPSVKPCITLKEYLNNKNYYISKYKIKLCQS